MLPALDSPFRWQDGHIAAELDGARALFTTRRGGVSSGAFDSLNLGLKTADERANVDENRRRVAAAVGEEVHEAFAGYDARRGQNLELAAVIRAKLEAAGVDEIHDVGLCTMCCFGLFFSHRRDGGVTGRQAGIVWRP